MTAVPFGGRGKIGGVGGGLSQIGTVLFPFEEAVLSQIRFLLWTSSVPDVLSLVFVLVGFSILHHCMYFS